MSEFPGHFIYNERADKQSNLTVDRSHLKIPKCQRDSAAAGSCFSAEDSDEEKEIASSINNQRPESLMSEDETEASQERTAQLDTNKLVKDPLNFHF